MKLFRDPDASISHPGDREQTPGTASDIYSFGIAALETAALDIQSVAPVAAVAAASITAAAVAAVESSAAGSSR